MTPRARGGESPRVTLKAAVTLDGRMATATGDSRWITGERARRRAHRLRSQHDAVMVGVGTVLFDDPRLTVRMVRGRNPLRVVLDTHLRTPDHAQVLDTGNAPTLIVHGPEAPTPRREALTREGVRLMEAPLHASRVDLAQVMEALASRGVRSILVEGGPTVHGALLDQDLADDAAIFVAPRIVGSASARPLADGAGMDVLAHAWHIPGVRIRKLGPDVLFEGALARGGAEGGT